MISAYLNYSLVRARARTRPPQKSLLFGIRRQRWWNEPIYSGVDEYTNIRRRFASLTLRTGNFVARFLARFVKVLCRSQVRACELPWWTIKIVRVEVHERNDDDDGDNLPKREKVTNNFFRAQIKCQTPFDIDAFTNEHQNPAIEFPSLRGTLSFPFVRVFSSFALFSPIYAVS